MYIDHPTAAEVFLDLLVHILAPGDQCGHQHASMVLSKQFNAL